MDPSIRLYLQLGSSKAEPSPRAREAELISRRGSLQLPPRGLRPRPGGTTVLPARPEAASSSSSSSNSGSSSRGGSAGRPGAGVPGSRMSNQLGSHLGERWVTSPGRLSTGGTKGDGAENPGSHVAFPTGCSRAQGLLSGFQFQVHRLQGLIEIGTGKGSPRHTVVLSLT